MTEKHDADIRRSQRTIDVTDITLENVRLGKITAEDLTIRRDTLLDGLCARFPQVPRGHWLDRWKDDPHAPDPDFVRVAAPGLLG